MVVVMTVGLAAGGAGALPLSLSQLGLPLVCHCRPRSEALVPIATFMTAPRPSLLTSIVCPGHLGSNEDLR